MYPPVGIADRSKKAYARPVPGAPVCGWKYHMAKAKDRHHVIPCVRCRELGIAPNFSGNVKRVSVSKHRAWHTLFGTALPEEAVEIIRRDWSLPEEGERALRRLLGNVSLLRRKK
jgi:hypothetical protein